MVRGAGWGYEYKDAYNASVHNALEQLGEDWEGELKIVSTKLRRRIAHADFIEPDGEAYVILVEIDCEAKQLDRSAVS